MTSESQRLYGKRTFAVLRDSIMASLTKRPMTCHEISRDCGIHEKTIAAHLQWLQTIGEVRNFDVPWRNGKRTLWRLNK